MRNLKNACQLFAEDVKNNWIPCIAIISYFIAARILFHSICPLVIMTGFPCPGCGLTRAGFAVMRGDFAGAWQLHPFIYVFLILAVMFVICRYFLNKKSRILKITAIASLILLIIFYVYRMIRFFPGESPMSYDYDNFLYRVYSLTQM